MRQRPVASRPISQPISAARPPAMGPRPIPMPTPIPGHPIPHPPPHRPPFPGPGPIPRPIPRPMPPFLPWNGNWLPGPFWAYPVIGAPYPVNFPFPPSMQYSIGMNVVDQFGRVWQLINIQGNQLTWVLISSPTPGLAIGTQVYTFNTPPQ